MLLQSYNDTIRIFPALPEEWEDIEFFDLPAQGGLKVSGVVRSGKVKRIAIMKDEEVIIRMNRLAPISINPFTNTPEIVKAEN